MQGNTHRVGGMVCALAGYTILESKGMLISGVSPLVQLVIIYPFAIYGSTFPDLDHNADSIPSKDIVSVGVNRVLHLTTKFRKYNKENSILRIFDAQHRSWQTHSDLFLVICLLFYHRVVSEPVVTAQGIILTLISIGFILGVISHMILDMLTPAGIWFCIPALLNMANKKLNLPFKIRLVPKSKFFATGGPWENIVRYVMWVFTIVLSLRILIGMLPYHLL